MVRKMTLSNALLTYLDKGNPADREKSFKVIAKYIADEEANWLRMNELEREMLEKDCKDQLEQTYVYAKEWKNKDLWKK